VYEHVLDAASSVFSNDSAYLDRFFLGMLTPNVQQDEIIAQALSGTARQ
jgi:hypothetical protein